MAHTLIETEDFDENLLFQMVNTIGGNLRSTRKLIGRRGRDEMVVYEIERKNLRCEIAISKKRKDQRNDTDWILVDCEISFWRKNTLYIDIVSFLNENK